MLELQSGKPLYFNETQLVSNAIESVNQPQGFDRLTSQVDLVNICGYLTDSIAIKANCI